MSRLHDMIFATRIRRGRNGLRRLSLLSAACIPLVLAGSLPARAAEHAAPASYSVTSTQSAPAQLVRTAVRKKRARRKPAVVISRGTRMGLHRTPDQLALRSSAAFVVDQDTGEMLAHKNADVVLPVASLTKLMTALVVLDAGQDLQQTLRIGAEDVDRSKYSSSRLPVGTQLRRQQMLLLALMSSENRAAMALSRHYPGGREAFVAQMNRKAQALGMASTHFADAAGLSDDSVSTARDLHRLVSAAEEQPLIRDYSTRLSSQVRVGRRLLTYVNSNRLVSRNAGWDIDLQKTGFTNAAGRCLVMQAHVLSRRLTMIFLDSAGNMTRYADATRVRRWLERESAKTRSAATS